MNEAILTSPRAVFLLAVLVAVGVVASIAWAEPQQVPEHGFAWKDGVEVYKKVCAVCHETHTGPLFWVRILILLTSKWLCDKEARPCRPFGYQKLMTKHWKNWPSMWRKLQPTSKEGPSHGDRSAQLDEGDVGGRGSVGIRYSLMDICGLTCAETQPLRAVVRRYQCGRDVREWRTGSLCWDDRRGAADRKAEKRTTG